MRTQPFSYVSSLIALLASTSIVSAQCPDVPANPIDDNEGAGFGTACVMSADGTIALVSGPGYDLGDGLVRSFNRVGNEWVDDLE
jgi:hypothetical protein